VSGFRFSVVGLCLITACGEKFTAHDGPGDNGGTSSISGAGGAREPVAGSGAGDNSAEAGEGGLPNETGGTGGGHTTVGAAGRGKGGAGGSSAGGSGAGGSGAGGSGAGGSNSGGSSSVGSSGSAGTGGALGDPSLPSGLALWLRADHEVQAKDGLVQVWQDQSGNKAHATQVTMNARPAYLATGFNGRPTLEFDGQGQFLKLPEGFGDFSNGLTGLIVAKPTKSDCASMVEFSNGSEIDDIAMGMFQDKWTYEVESPWMQTGSVEHGAFTLYAANHRTAGASELRINGSVLATLEMPLPVVPSSGVRSNNFVGHTLYGGGCEYFKGQISEIIVYSRTLTNVEVGAIEKYLDAHWSLSTQELPTPTP